jgi:ribose transport system ATP-binding protein
MKEIQPILSMYDICKYFPGVLALDHVSFNVFRGEVHCLVGENGAGKSTLMKILSGAYRKDAGIITINGERVEIADAHHSRELGIGIIYQEMNLVPGMSVAENIFLGNEPVRNRLQSLDWKTIHRKADAILAELEATFSSRDWVKNLTTGQQQLVEIAKALVLEKEILIMDEPTTSLSEKDTQKLFSIIRRLKEQGVAIIYISHRLPELSEIADRVTVLRDGKKAGTLKMKDTELATFIQMMVGRPLAEMIDHRIADRKDRREILKVEGLCTDKLDQVSFHLHQGEILGFAGLVGSGRTELMRAIFGADPVAGGDIYLEGQLLKLKSPADAVKQGIGFLTEDRKAQGLVQGMSVLKNISLAVLERYSKFTKLDRKREQSESERFVRELKIATPSLQQLTRNLSGGNQQKVILARWLLTDSKILIFDEPTRGIDIGAKAEIYQIMQNLVNSGTSIIMVSSDLREILEMSDRIVVMNGGAVVGEISREEATQEKLMAMMLGGKKRAS